MCRMRFDMKSKPSRVVSGIIVVAMLLTITGQLLLLDSTDKDLLVAPWIIIILGTIVLAWSLFHLFRPDPSDT